MPKLPRVTAHEIISVLERQRFLLTRQTGSHKIYYREGKRVTVPFHGSKILHPKILRDILRDAQLSADELLSLLKK